MQDQYSCMDIEIALTLSPLAISSWKWIAINTGVKVAMSWNWSPKSSYLLFYCWWSRYGYAFAWNTIARTVRGPDRVHFVNWDTMYTSLQYFVKYIVWMIRCIPASGMNSSKIWYRYDMQVYIKVKIFTRNDWHKLFRTKRFIIWCLASNVA